MQWLGWPGPPPATHGIPLWAGGEFRDDNKYILYFTNQSRWQIIWVLGVASCPKNSNWMTKISYNHSWSEELEPARWHISKGRVWLTTCKNSHSWSFFISYLWFLIFSTRCNRDYAFHAIAPLNLLCCGWFPGINSDPEFRKSFCEMCIASGVDPLSSSDSDSMEVFTFGFPIQKAEPYCTFFGCKAKGMKWNVYNPALIQTENLRLHHDWYVIQSWIWDHDVLYMFWRPWESPTYVFHCQIVLLWCLLGG